MDDPSLGAEQLSRAVLLSPSQLYRKPNALTGEPPNAFIRKIRLHRAMEMLETTELNISEIAYSVGFNGPNYFTRTFVKEFGKTPSDFRKYLIYCNLYFNFLSVCKNCPILFLPFANPVQFFENSVRLVGGGLW